jgi:hypothetical protein
MSKVTDKQIVSYLNSLVNIRTEPADLWWIQEEAIELLNRIYQEGIEPTKEV